MKNNCTSECFEGSSNEGQVDYFYIKNTIYNINRFQMVPINKVSNIHGYHNLVVVCRHFNIIIHRLMDVMYQDVSTHEETHQNKINITTEFTEE